MWMDVIQKMDEVYSKLVADEIALEEKNAQLEQSYDQLQKAHEALKQTQQQLLHSEKMASLGRLVAGVAHELNNPISFVLGNVHALQRYIERLREYLEAQHDQTQTSHLALLRESLRIDAISQDLPSLITGTMEGAQRTADIVNGLKRFSAFDRESWQTFALEPVIESAILWVRKGTAPQFRITWQAHQPHHWVLGHAGQIQQVMMNLIQNAYDAAQSNGEPHLSISYATTAGDASADHHVALCFSDNGTGITPEQMPHIFDPFYTTKAIGKGTGLGLSISYGIVEQHLGSLTAKPYGELDGAVFTLTLPLTH